ncbi:hypothetical protein HYX02_04955 [Candidatus Woesearchaeota archaeon]|nr:hypothetical protein [Candidatus Woesearchaeota archaeon]
MVKIRRKTIFYLSCLTLLIFIAACGGGGGSSAQIGCYPKGTEPNPDVRPVPGGSLSKDNFGGYYPGGDYKRTSIFEPDSDERACACLKDTFWDAECCGDDSIEQDDPDKRELFCTSCKIGDNSGRRVWDNEQGKCCGDDKEDEPDWSAVSCTSCPVGNNAGSRDWSDGGCCGDDETDCALQAKGGICHLDAEGTTPFWMQSSELKGDIKYLGCADKEYIADGSAWKACDGAFWQTKVSGNEFMCTGKGKESIVECCGSSSCKSSTDGKRLAAGQSVNYSNKVYYCASDKTFTTDLDTKDKSTCEKAGFKWTGTKCCSEADDSNEYYNDAGVIGGCWNKEFVRSIDVVKGTDDSVINYQGSFHGCAIDKINFNKDNDNLLGLSDKSGVPLITNHDYCFKDPENNYYCSFTEKWILTNGNDKSHLSFAPVANPNLAAECCAQDECWDGTICAENQRNKPLAQPVNGLRCIDGNWTTSALKFTPDEDISGFCPKQSQCLSSVFGQTNQCIESGEYVNDNYCENGLWTTRTKLLALKLLKLKSGDYTLFCDARENSLNNLQYLTDSNELISDVLSNIQTNNFCVLKAGSRITAATSINKNLEEAPATALNILGITSCDKALIDDGNYHACDTTNKVWYNKRLKSFIYSQSAITVPSEQETTTFFGSLIQSIISSIKRLITSPPFDESYVKGMKKFDKLYLSQQAGKTIKGSIEGKNFKNAVVEYSGFDADICGFTNKFSEARKDVASGVSCKKEGNNYYVLAQGSSFTSVNPEQIWPDLTAKLRLK